MKIGILGHFGDGVSLLNGQTIKTKSLVNGLERYTDTEIVRIDTYGWIKKPILLLRLINSRLKKLKKPIGTVLY